MEATLRGDLDRDAGNYLLDLVQTRLKAIEVTDLETRLADQGKAAATVELPGARNIRRVRAARIRGLALAAISGSRRSTAK